MATTKATRAQGPHIPPPYEAADASAIQALQLGQATPDQQVRALKWIIERGAGAYEFNFYPSDRETAFALGRAFVGQQLVKLLKLNVSSLRRQENVEAS
ncbi:hypothetical protein UFOVP241_4 [uncultured Caudovirales phage]|uniref:Uncharacterized protein n=1 Tax=uncultured Caudovirales phage TaxID=2100421 RepID=A0A6J7WUS5_9CAUD|nr:hypothetical protein UFOVP241_4 [uncultured Caudovirales phage]